MHDPVEVAMDRADERLVKIIDGIAAHFPGQGPAIIGIARHVIQNVDGLVDSSEWSACHCSESAGA